MELEYKVKHMACGAKVYAAGSSSYVRLDWRSPGRTVAALVKPLQGVVDHVIIEAEPKNREEMILLAKAYLETIPPEPACEGCGQMLERDGWCDSICEEASL